MISPSTALKPVPDGLRVPLIDEYRSISRHYAEHKWRPSELSGGFFCEIVYTVLHGHAAQAYANKPSKPANFVAECRKLETNTHVPRSFQILIPRALPTLYEVRNNRGVGHTGGDVDSNRMDATLVLGMCNWIMAELVRVFHNLHIDEAQSLVDSLTDRRIPLVWEGGAMRRVLDPTLKLREQILLLLASTSGTTEVSNLLDWTGYENKAYFLKNLRELHALRRIELSKDEKQIVILPPGTVIVDEIISGTLRA